MESILRTAHCLVMPVLIEAAEQYIIQYVVQKAPVEVPTWLRSMSCRSLRSYAAILQLLCEIRRLQRQRSVVSRSCS